MKLNNNNNSDRSVRLEIFARGKAAVKNCTDTHICVASRYDTVLNIANFLLKQETKEKFLS